MRSLVIVMGATLALGCEVAEDLEDLLWEANPGSAEQVSTPEEKEGADERSVDVQAEALGLQRLPDGRYRHHDPRGRFTATVDVDGTVVFDDRRSGKATVPERGGGIRVSGPGDWSMKASGREPHAADKRKLLEHTRELRAKMAVEHRRKLASEPAPKTPANAG